MPHTLSKDLLDWYARHAREMPWRDHPDPYAVWVSEIMLQQTRVETVKAYFEKWMTEFPTITALAAASQRDVLNAWEGLGYYSRARNLHKAAQILTSEQGGKLPADVKALRKLPGIGPYTAGAIASISFGLDEPLVDGNVSRVYARIFNVTDPIDSTDRKKTDLENRSRAASGRAGRGLQPGTHGFGSCNLHLRKAPACPTCPVRAHCQANALGVQSQLPVRVPKVKVPHYIVTAAVIRKADKILIAQRPPDGLLGGMWEFPGGKLETGEDLPGCLRREIWEELGVEITVGNGMGTIQTCLYSFQSDAPRLCLSAHSSRTRPRLQSRLLISSGLIWKS